MLAARSSAIWATLRSLGTLIESAPSPAQTRNAAGLVGPVSTLTLKRMSAGSSPASRSWCAAHSTPSSATSTLRTPSSAARAQSTRHCPSWSRPRARGPLPPDSERVAAPVSQVPRGPRKSETSMLPASVEHRRDLVVGEHHHAAALADPVDRDAVRLRLLEHRFQRVRPFDRRDLDPPGPAVREPLLRRHRARLRDVQPEPGECGFSWEWLHVVLLLHVKRRTFHERGGRSVPVTRPGRDGLRGGGVRGGQVAVEHEVLAQARSPGRARPDRAAARARTAIDREHRQPVVGEHRGRLQHVVLHLDAQHRPAAEARGVREREERRLPPRRAAVERPDRRDHVHELREAADLHPVGVAQQRDQQAADDERVGDRVLVLGERRRVLPRPFVTDVVRVGRLMPHVPLVDADPHPLA